MAEVLSQSEVESLLSALDQSGDGANPVGTASQGDNFNNEVSIYDFKRPERVSKEQMHAFQALHESFSREFGAAMSGMLRSIVEVKLISVDQLTYGEFVLSLGNPTCFNLIEADELEGNIILDLNPSIIFPIFDRLLGGGKGSSQSIPNRALTQIELSVVARITDLAIRGIENAWSNVCEWHLRVGEVESNPQLVQVVPPNEVIVLISFEISLSDSRGIMNLCIPFNTIEPLMSKLSSDTWSAYKKRVTDPRQKLNLETGLSQAHVDVMVRLAETQLSAQDVMKLAVGDVILTEREANDGITVMIEGRPTFRGFPGLYKGRKAVQIGKSIVRLQDVIEKKLQAQQTDKAQAVDRPA